MSEAERLPHKDVGDLLAFAFLTTTLMWTVGYALRLPGITLPSPLVGVLILGTLALGAFIFGRETPRPPLSGIYLGVTISLLNMLVLGGILTKETLGEQVPTPLIWIPGSVVGFALICLISTYLGKLSATVMPKPRNWKCIFAGVSAFSTFILLVVGGIVTSKDAGLAVVDWPNTFGYNMFLFPLSKMSGGIYYEHAHRLFGALVGLTILVLAVYLQLVETRRYVKVLSVSALVLVIVQGVLGGLRVTGTFTLSSSPEMMLPNPYLAVIHGVLGQLLFALLVALTIFTSGSLDSASILHTRNPPADITVNWVLVSLLALQLLIGAGLRHVGIWLVPHIIVAIILVAVAFYAGARVFFRLGVAVPMVKRAGLVLVILASVQAVLGIGSYIVTWTPFSEPLHQMQVALTTAHQAVSALLIASAVALLLWESRLLKEPKEDVSV